MFEPENFMQRLLTILVAGLVLGGPLFAQGDPTRLLRDPDISASHLVFVYAGDRKGGSDRLVLWRRYRAFLRAGQR